MWVWEYGRIDATVIVKSCKFKTNSDQGFETAAQKKEKRERKKKETSNNNSSNLICRFETAIKDSRVFCSSAILRDWNGFEDFFN
jgi:hypothetical protein